MPPQGGFPMQTTLQNGVGILRKKDSAVTDSVSPEVYQLKSKPAFNIDPKTIFEGGTVPADFSPLTVNGTTSYSPEANEWGTKPLSNTDASLLYEGGDAPDDFPSVTIGEEEAPGPTPTPGPTPGPTPTPDPSPAPTVRGGLG